MKKKFWKTVFLAAALLLSPPPLFSKGAKAPQDILKGRIICIDPGHGLTKKKYNEKIAPTSTKTKPAFVSGTRGAKYTEEQLVLIVGKKLQTRLQELGATVLMTRETHEAERSNIERAVLANEAGADMAVRLHADAGPTKAVSGMHMLVPSSEYVKTPGVVAESKKLAQLVLKNCVAETGAKNRGVMERSDMTGLNWSTVPVILLEMGFMTNAQEDALLSTDAYQEKIVNGIVRGILEYYGVK
ncbi:MAG: N-acetylmuramoyl-L-alanine amidase [Fusobacteriaceae bacterium]|jgi:N-acetylmuramoyl-L-alanine amidase|nr:N-acetylmuramoyl-L-alanine amidase [Fusobacteriaceae bacterium]